MLASLAVIRILRFVLCPSGTLDVVLAVRIFKGVKKIAEFTTLRTLEYAADGAPPGYHVDELAVELFTAVPTSLQIPTSSSRLSLRVILNVQIAAQMNFHITTTLEGLNPPERFQFAYYVLEKLVEVTQHFWTLELERHVGVVFRRVLLERKMGIESGYQDHLAQKDSTMILGTRVSIPKRNKSQLQSIRVLQITIKIQF